ncbi:lipopolysaccharide biosynthesis protein [Janthinobacterium agaricidamnosum]|uniref:Polysaccharide biosynthesis family protein n=1 Tax=Janthinobacterium agaricidamnosum NBRC 102515 = DSM 9628 TaxID=1349767 RepID=W0V7P3_9BURK|nr:lipopolysaccharide biosynthesis protein [Janthinobacterium agaricidamnosum]CDG83287.1 polysaccharide biosynthesis family protein [Janthinobacterium agaricidamnosum NBRC 102515 = DSM 9628]
MSLLFSFGEKYTALLLGMAGTMVLARLLTPAEIGVYSVGAVLVGLAQVVRDFGVGQYLIQEKELTTAKIRAALATSMIVAWLLAALVLLASGLVARFYGEPRLQGVLQCLSVNFILIPFSATTLPYLRRQMRFSAMYAINTSNSAVSLLVALLLALLGFGYLSLVWAAVAGTGAALLVSLWLRPPELPWLPHHRGIGKIMSFGALSTGGGLIDEAGVAAPELVIGKMIDIASVGIFGKAQGMLNVFNQAITSAISPVIFPLFAARARDGGDVRLAYLHTISYLTALAWPFFIFLGLMALPLVNLLYGPQWNAAVPLIRIMCASSALYSMFSMARYLFVAIGHVKAQAQLDAQAVPPRIAGIVIAAPFGLEAVAWAVLLGTLLRSWLTYRCLARLSGMTLQPMLLAVRKSLALCCLTALAPLLVLLLMRPHAGDWLWPLAVAALGALLCWVAGVLLLKHEIALEFDIVRRKVFGLPHPHHVVK